MAFDHCGPRELFDRLNYRSSLAIALKIHHEDE